MAGSADYPAASLYRHCEITWREVCSIASDGIEEIEANYAPAPKTAKKNICKQRPVSGFLNLKPGVLFLFTEIVAQAKIGHNLLKKAMKSGLV